MKNDSDISWLPEPEDQDYPAALSYLSLIYSNDIAQKFVTGLRDAAVTTFKAKDIFRSSRLPLLDITNFHVKKDTQKIKEGDKLSPVLLVRDSTNGNLIIADGYHRLCAVYSFDEDALIPCKIV
jgi:hypothetical protein